MIQPPAKRRQRVHHQVHHDYEGGWPKWAKPVLLGIAATVILQAVGFVVMGSWYAAQIDSAVKDNSDQIEATIDTFKAFMDATNEELDRIETGVRANYVNNRDLENLIGRIDRYEARSDGQFVRLGDKLDKIIQRQDVYLNQRQP